MAYIVYNANRIEFNKSISIGRDSSSDLRIEEPTVSRNHAVIKQIGDKYYIIDLGSSNGTFKNGKRVRSPLILENKSVIQCGNTQVIFYDNKSQENDDETVIACTSNFIVKSIVLVADIRGYTEFSEKVSIQIVSKLMAHWYKEITVCIENNNGYIDSFIGDCVYARWDENITKDVILNILRVTKEINDITKKISLALTNGEKELHVGVGLNIGEVIVGIDTHNTGLGDTVNTAFRFESHTRFLDVDVIVSNEICEFLDLQQPLIDIYLKGKTTSIRVYTLNFDEIDKIIYLSQTVQ